MAFSSALLISTYNWPDALQLVLKSALVQSQLPNEILIADDGSKEETKLLIERFQKISPVPIKHFWQEDEGFRKSKILNKSVAGTTADYIIQVDGDCVMHPKLVEDHCRAAEKSVYLYGSRVNILPNAVASVFENQTMVFNMRSKEIKNKTRALHIPMLANLYNAHQGLSKKFRGCNVSYWRTDFVAINGYNEDYEGWGREDSDLVIRLGNNGVRAKRLRYAGIVYHLHHKVSSKEKLEINNRMQDETLAKKITRIQNGVDQYF